jgi:hypothetical protein
LGAALAKLQALSPPVPARETACGDTPGGGKPQQPCGFEEPVPAVPGVPDENVASGKIHPCGHPAAAGFPPALSKAAGTGGDSGDIQQRRGFGVSPPSNTEAGTAGTTAAWTDDRAWIAEIVRATTTDEKLAMLFWWVLAAGGWIDGMTALLPALPRRYAALELRRMLRQSGIEIREALP